MGQIKLKINLKRDTKYLNIDEEIPSQGITVLFGASASGKTSLLRCIAGLENPIDSEITIDNVVLQSKDKFVPAHLRQVGLVLQEGYLFPHLNVQDNLNLALKFRKNSTFSLEQVINWFNLTKLLNKAPHELSGGQKQRVILAQCLLSSPRLLLLDEALNALDEITKSHLLDVLLVVAKQIPIICVTHSYKELSYLADHVILMSDCKVDFNGTLSQALSYMNKHSAYGGKKRSLIAATISEHDNEYALTQVRLQQQTLWVAQQEHLSGERVTLLINARDISITLEKPSQTSILNILSGKVDEVIENSTELPASHCLVNIKIDNQFVWAELTKKSLHYLNLCKGKSVFVQIKSVAVE